MMKSFGDADIYINTTIPDTVDKVIVAIEGEHGCAPYLALSSFIGDMKPSAHFVSRFMRQDSINTIPDPEDPGWPIYCFGDTLVVIIRTYHTPESLGMHSQTMWTYYYPVIRGLALALESLGVTEMDFLNVTYAHEMVPDEMFKQLSNEEVVVYTLKQEKEVQDIFLHSPAWLTTWIFSHLGLYTAKITSVGWAAEGLIDEVASNTLVEYIRSQYSLEQQDGAYEKMKSDLLEAHEFEQEMMRNAYIEIPKNSIGDGVMFG
jgi:hypothetical protein